MHLKTEILPLQTKHEFIISRAGEPAARRDVWVRITDDNAHEGWGEAAPNAYYQQSADTACAALEVLEPLLRPYSTVTLADLVDLERELNERAPAHSSAARAALSAAFLDLIGRKVNRPVWQLLGMASPSAPRSSFTIGIDEIDVMRAKVREARSYSILKVKVGTPNDEEVLTMLREERPDAVVRVDANTGWTRDEALSNVPMLERFGVELIEQPVKPDDLDGLAAIQRATSLPVIADESCLVAADIPRLVGRIKGINIKLSKCGSLLEAVRMVQLAREHDMKVMLGCMVEATLGIAAAVQIAPLVDYVDLDGAALLSNDPFVGPGIEADGTVRFNTSGGLGVRLR